MLADRRSLKKKSKMYVKQENTVDVEQNLGTQGFTRCSTGETDRIYGL